MPLNILQKSSTKPHCQRTLHTFKQNLYETTVGWRSHAKCNLLSKMNSSFNAIVIINQNESFRLWASNLKDVAFKILEFIYSIIEHRLST